MWENFLLAVLAGVFFICVFGLLEKKSPGSGILVIGLIGLVISVTGLAIYVPILLETSNQQQVESTQDELGFDDSLVDIPDGYKFVQWVTEGKSYIIEDAYGTRTIVVIEFDDGGSPPEETEPPHATQDQTNTTISIPDGYKFIAWADEDKTSYIVEDKNGNQQVIIIQD